MPVTTQRVAADVDPEGMTFPTHVRAYAELARTVRERGLLVRRPWFYFGVALVQLAALAVIITAFVLVGDSWFQLIVAGALGVWFAQIALVAHEAAHRQIFAGMRANTFIARIAGNALVGISYDWWNNKHTRHHSNPNEVGKDPDIQSKVVAFTPDDAVQAKGIFRAIIKRQGWFLFPLLALEGLNLHGQSFRHLLSPRRRVDRRFVEILYLVIHFAALMIPVFMFLSLGIALAFLAVEVVVFGFYMGCVFAPNHKGMVIFDEDTPIDFFSRQVRSSRNVRGGWWMTTLMGGLNYQIEHHLFPGMSRTALAETRELVREHCRKYDVPYTEVSLVRSYAITVAYLNRVGLAARDPWECPLTAQRFRG